MPEAGEKCIKCGQTVATVMNDSSDLSSSFNKQTPSLQCGCDDLQGPRTASDVDED